MAGPIRVLHVDDDPDFADVTATLLERESEQLTVETATSVEAATALLTADVDCIVSDYDMPGRNGIEFLQTVRERFPDLPFVLYTGKGSEEIASEAISAGVTDYLQKEGGTEQYTLLANRIENAVEAYRSRQTLKERTRRQETLITNLPGMVYRCKNERGWPMEEVEGDAEELTGYTAAELEGDDVAWGEDVIHPDDQAAMWDAVQDALSDGDSFEVTYRIVTADDATKWAWEQGRAVDTDDGDTEVLEGFVTDITEQKEDEQRLQRTTARLEALFENSPVMINVHDTDGNLIEPNPRLCEKTGYDADELTGMKVWDLDLTIDPEEARTVWENMEVGDREQLEGVYRRRDGSTFPTEVHIRRLNLEGEDRFIVISRDITDRKERERELEHHNERLERFASVVSHDLRNPLGVAEGRLELARQDCESEHLDAVERAHDRMGALIDDLLALARDGTPVEKRDTVDLGELVESCWETVDTTGATLVLDTDHTVRADTSRLRQLFENLIRNAVEHGSTSPDSQTRRDAVERDSGGVTITVGALEDGFYVADDGPGIPAEERSDVFDSGYSMSEDGTGFGLAIVAEIVEAHGWEVDLTDSEDGGARFEVTGVELQAE